LLSAVLLNCALYAILRFHALASRAIGAAFSAHLLLAFGLLSIAVAVPFLLIQHDIKRLLAYSSMEHIGIIAVAAGIGGALGTFAALLHLINHAAAKSTMFLGSGTVIQRLGSRNIHRLGGAGRVAPGLAALLLLGGLALAGSPPFSPFVSEFTAVRAAFVAHEAWVSVIVLVLLALAFGGLLAHIGRVALGPAGRRGRAQAAPTAGPREAIGAAALAVPAVAVVALGLHVPEGLVTLLQQAAQVIGG
jgi:hydrogenase-4 component F